MAGDLPAEDDGASQSHGYIALKAPIDEPWHARPHWSDRGHPEVGRVSTFFTGVQIAPVLDSVREAHPGLVRREFNEAHSDVRPVGAWLKSVALVSNTRRRAVPTLGYPR